MWFTEHIDVSLLKLVPVKTFGLEAYNNLGVVLSIFLFINISLCSNVKDTGCYASIIEYEKRNWHVQ